MRKIALYSIIWFVPVFTFSQNYSNCDSLYNSLDSINRTRGVGCSFFVPNPTNKVKCKCSNSCKGNVRLEMVIDTFGLTRCIKVIYSDNNLLDSIATKCVEKTTYEIYQPIGKKDLFVNEIWISFK